MSNQSFQTPKNFYSNSPSAQKPPHMLPPLNASRKYMSFGNIENSIDYNSSYAQQTPPNPHESYTNNTMHTNGHGNNKNSSLPNSREINNFEMNNPMYADDYLASDAASQEFDALQSRRKLLHELSVIGMHCAILFVF